MPLLDEAIDALPDSDRELVLPRFFERRSFREISETTGKSEAASQKQAERALQKLAQSLRRKGVAISTTLLVSGLAAKVAEAAPASLAAAVSQGALAGAAGVAAKTTLLNTIAAMSYAKTAIIVAAIAAIPLASQWRDNNRLEGELQELRHDLHAARELADTPRSKRPVSFKTRFDREPGRKVATTKETAGPLPGPVPPTSHEYARMWEMALFSSDPVQRSIELSALLKDLTAENAPAVAAAFERAKSKGLRFNEERRLFLRAWGDLDGRAAVANAMGTGEVKATGEVLAALAGWAARDPHTARTWVDSLEGNKDQERIALGLIDGWSTTDFHGAENRSDGHSVFEKPLLKGWTLEKTAHATINHPVGKGCYYDTHRLIHRDREIVHDFPDWEWADLDGNRLVWVEKGVLYKSQITSKGVGYARELCDFNPMEFEALAAPY